MTPLATDRDHAIPVELLTALRTARTADPDTFQTTLRAWDLRQLDGGRNHHVYAWAAPDGELCIKLYTKTDRHRAEREWHGLTHVAPLGCAPTPLWLDQHPEHPALSMTLIPGTPILEHPDPATAITFLAQTTRAMQALPLTEPLASLQRVDSVTSASVSEVLVTETAIIARAGPGPSQDHLV